jgi:hypothetical protein
MTVFHFTDPSGRLLGVVRAADGDESAARELMAGKGKARDERFLGHDGGIVCSAVEHDGAARVLWRDEAAPAPETKASETKADEKHVAGGKPDNREIK